jgi:opacity protein-like surface antigen
MRKILTVIAATAAFVPFMAQAEGLSYTYAEAGWLQTDVNQFDNIDVNETLGGWGLKASFEIIDNLFVYGRYADQKTDTKAGEYTLQPWDLGVGYAFPINDTFDIYGMVGYSNVDMDAPGAWKNNDDDGYTLGVGARAQLIEKLELEGTFRYANLSDYSDQYGFDIAGRWFFTDAIAVGLQYSLGDNFDTFGASVRYQFPAK